MWRLKNRFIALFVTFLILIAVFGVGSAAADNSINSNSNDNSTSSDSVSDHSAGDSSSSDQSISGGSTDNNLTNGGSTDNNLTNGGSTDNNLTNGGSTDNNLTSGGSTDNNLTIGDSTDNNLTSGGSTDNNLTNGGSTNKGNLSGDNGEISYPDYYERSPEPHGNIYYVQTTTIYINNEHNANVNFIDNSVVNNINFEVKTSSGDTKKASGGTTVVVENLKDISRLTDKPPVGKIYKAFNIWVDNGASNIKDSSVNFKSVNLKVEKEWINANRIDQSTIVLNVYIDGKWIKVPLTITSEDAKYVYCTAKVSGYYSSFAITGQQVVDSSVKASSSTGQVSMSSTNNSNENSRVIIIGRILDILERILDMLK